MSLPRMSVRRQSAGSCRSTSRMPMPSERCSLRSGQISCFTARLTPMWTAASATRILLTKSMLWEPGPWQALPEEVGAALVAISTDFVFDGAKGSAYTEFDTPNPISHYGASKLAGEKLARSACRRCYIVRTSWLYGVHGKNFPYTVINLAKTKPETANCRRSVWDTHLHGRLNPGDNRDCLHASLRCLSCQQSRRDELGRICAGDPRWNGS